MNNKKWKLLRSKPIFESKYLSILENDYELPDGSEGKGYYHLSRPDYVLVVAIDQNNNLVVERNYRRGVDDFNYELPAGWIDPGETPKEAAEREFKEETGYTGEVEILGEIYTQPAFTSMKAYVGFTKIDSRIKEEQSLEHDEDIKCELLHIDTVISMIEKGEIKDMGFLTGLQMATRLLK